MRRVLVLSALATLIVSAAVSAPAVADGPQLEDPAGDHPVPWVDLVGVELKLGAGNVRTGPVLEVTFSVAGDITPENRNTMTGLNFDAKIGSCKFGAGYNAFPGATEAELGAGSAGAICEGGKELEPPFKVQGNSVTLTIALRDLKGVVAGAVVSEMSASSVPMQGFAGDDTGALALTGDTASSDKSFPLS
jgi:hypothetical protein